MSKAIETLLQSLRKEDEEGQGVYIGGGALLIIVLIILLILLL